MDGNATVRDATHITSRGQCQASSAGRSAIERRDWVAAGKWGVMDAAVLFWLALCVLLIWWSKSLTVKILWLFVGIDQSSDLFHPSLKITLKYLAADLFIFSLCLVSSLILVLFTVTPADFNRMSGMLPIWAGSTGADGVLSCTCTRSLNLFLSSLKFDL